MSANFVIGFKWSISINTNFKRIHKNIKHFSARPYSIENAMKFVNMFETSFKIILTLLKTIYLKNLKIIHLKSFSLKKKEKIIKLCFEDFSATLGFIETIRFELFFNFHFANNKYIFNLSKFINVILVINTICDPYYCYTAFIERLIYCYSILPHSSHHICSSHHKLLFNWTFFSLTTLVVTSPYHHQPIS